MPAKVLTVSILTAATLIACAPEDPRPKIATRMDAVEGGRVDMERTNVVLVVAQQGWAGGICTGSLIAPNLVLTAQHCIAELNSEYVDCRRSRFGEVFSPNALGVTTEAQMPRSGNRYVGVREIIVPEPQQLVCGNDIALLVLNRNLSDAQATPLIPRLDPPPARGEQVTVVGYGHTGDGSGSGVRRSRSGISILCAGGSCRGLGSTATEFVADEGTCQGDSGGPALDAQGRVLGALSRGANGCSYPTYTGVFGYADWLRAQAQRAAALGGYPPADWVGGDIGPDRDNDGVSDAFDNCPDHFNPDQSDIDNDGLGDVCDDRNDLDRGGSCAICNGCNSDRDCFGGTLCAQTESGFGVCVKQCATSSDCPGTTACYPIQRGLNLCLNADADTAGVCPADFICGGDRRPDPPVEPEQPPPQDPQDPQDPEPVDPELPAGGASGEEPSEPGADPDDGAGPAVTLIPEIRSGGGGGGGCAAAADAPTPPALPWLALGLLGLVRRRR